MLLLNTILSSVLLACYCNALPQQFPDSSDSSASAAAAAAASASASGSDQNCPPPNNPCPPPNNPCPPPFNPNPCPPPFNPNPCPPPFNPNPCPPPFNPNPCPPPFNPNPCPPPCPPAPHPPSPFCPPPHPPNPFCPPSPHPPSPNCPPPNCPSPNGAAGSASASASAAASASGSGVGAASASASASASTSVQVPNLQQVCSYPTDVQQCSQVYAMKYQQTDLMKLHNKVFYIYHASKTEQQLTFDSATCFDFFCHQSCQTIMVKFMVESTTSISKVAWGCDATGNLAYVKTKVQIISQEYMVMQDTFADAQKVSSGSTSAIASTQTQQLEQFITSSSYVMMYTDYEHILAMKRCSDSSLFVAVCERLYTDQQQLQTNAMSAIQSILSFHQVNVNMCSTLTQRFSMDINSIAITSASFEMSKNDDGSLTTGNKIERKDGGSIMAGETSVTRGQNGDVSMSSSTQANLSMGTSPCPTSGGPAGSGAASASASAAASASAGSGSI